MIIMTRASSFVSQMMLQIIRSPSLPLFTSLVLLVVLAIYWKRFRSHTCPIDLRLPPEPWKLHLIGSLHQLAGSLQHHCLTDLAKKYGPIMHLKLPLSPNCRPALIFVPDNDHWREMRKVCMLELLSAKQVWSFSSIRNEEASSLVQSISSSEGHPVNLSDMIFNMQNCITARAALGKKCKHQQEFISLVEEMGKFVLLRYVTGLKPASEKIHRKMDRILEEVINDLRKKRKAAFALLTNKNNKESCHQEEEEDLVDVLLQLQESGELQIDLTNTIIKAVTLDLYFAGSETAAATTEWAMSELVRNPRAMESTGGDDDEQSGLLLHKIGMYDIPSKSRVLINAWGMWENPDCFMPDRFQGCRVDFRGNDFKFIPFGEVRECVQAYYLELHPLSLLAQLLYHFNWKLPPPSPVVLKNAFNATQEEEEQEQQQQLQLDMTEPIKLAAIKKNDLYVIAIPFIP
ncbi:hypothetical protein PRUPE_7G066000 [Prunus persica]|uniref:Cytochrome P450 n=1 Tax=Prunus persica TaxID=3760 RepID=A0A251N7P9_PRUPE|nr:hypothetical protein PRUPE_7G066000 [Prunus persica]